jgi:uncharacterized RDD family membrane protein YckC
LNCPSCRRGLPAGGSERCPFCGVLLSAPTEGALAAEPRLELENMEPLREIPGLRRPARTWKDEVRERVRQRKQQRIGGELPLFPDEDAASPDVDAEPRFGGGLRIEPASPDELAPGRESGLSDLGDEPPVMAEARRHERESRREVAADDLPLRPRDTRPFLAAPELAPEAPVRREVLLDDVLEEEPASERWDTFDARTEMSTDAAPLERPARAAERAQAAALDLTLLVGLWSVVVYFASRAAHVTVAGLLPSWPYLAGYLAALGLIYAGYFTGTTGQTLGKLAFGLRVVDAAGQPPGYARALGRALLGSAGVLAAGAGLVPIAFDPARRALHDRVLKTRVVHF